MKTRVHINRHLVAANRRTGGREAVVTVSNYRGTRRGNAVEILGPARLVYSPDRPLPCGATVWLETTADVVVA